MVFWTVLCVVCYEYKFCCIIFFELNLLKKHIIKVL